MLKIILMCQLVFFIAFGISYGELRNLAYDKGKSDGFIDASEYMSLEQLQNVKITES